MVVLLTISLQHLKTNNQLESDVGPLLLSLSGVNGTAAG